MTDTLIKAPVVNFMWEVPEMEREMRKRLWGKPTRRLQHDNLANAGVLRFAKLQYALMWVYQRMIRVPEEDCDQEIEGEFVGLHLQENQLVLYTLKGPYFVRIEPRRFSPFAEISVIRSPDIKKPLTEQF